MAVDCDPVSVLEDDFTDVLRKALLGHGFAPAAAATRAGLAPSEVLALLQGDFCAHTARQLAAVLGLNVKACASHAVYRPRPLTAPGITQLDLPFGTGRVNAWLVCEGGACLLFDAGYQATDLLQALHAHGHRWPDRGFITHTHRDHIGALASLVDAAVPVHAAGLASTIPMTAGETLVCGPLSIRACDLSGHASPALGFHVEGLDQPVLVTGDALFAGSMGGCASPASYQHARQRLHEVLGPLPDATVLLPGHGPPSTLGEERRSNPFL